MNAVVNRKITENECSAFFLIKSLPYGDIVYTQRDPSGSSQEKSHILCRLEDVLRAK